jgi:hypothetical protein
MKRTTEGSKTVTSEVAIFGRILANGQRELSPALARYVLGLGFTEEDRSRMADLAERNQDGALSAEEHEELMNYVGASHLLALLHARARKALKTKHAS